MSMYDQAYARAMRVWKKARREGWLDEHLRGNTRGKKASKEAFSAGYLRAIVDFETVLRREEDGKSYLDYAEQHEDRKVQPRNQPNLSGKETKGVI